MSIFDNPFDPKRVLAGCNCGQHADQAQHNRDARLLLHQTLASEDKRYETVAASAVLRAVIPDATTRRTFLHSLGASTALAALSQFFPLKTATEAFAEGGPEKKDLKVGFIPLTCATPIIMAA